jgi:AAA+ ATPase superfamily predicted ATPase
MLNQKLASGNPELIAVYGRRRVGKTYLIRTSLKNSIVFEMTGIRRVLRGLRDLGPFRSI